MTIATRVFLFGNVLCDSGFARDAYADAVARYESQSPPIPFWDFLVEEGLASREEVDAVHAKIEAMGESRAGAGDDLEATRHAMEGEALEGEAIGSIALREGLITPDQLARALQEQVQRQQLGTDARIGTILIAHGALDGDDVVRLLESQNKQIVACGVCGKQWNARLDARSRPRCPSCDGELLTELDRTLVNVGVDATIITDDPFAGMTTSVDDPPGTDAGFALAATAIGDAPEVGPPASDAESTQVADSPPPGSDDGSSPSLGSASRHLGPSAVGSARPAGVGGRQLGRWEVLTKLGEGGMGAVYKVRAAADAAPPSTDGEEAMAGLGPLFALKLLTASVSRNPKMVDRFIREMKTARSLRHENIIRFVDHGDEKGFHWYVMEFVDGRDARSLVQRGGRLDPASALWILRETARGLAYAHGQRMIHRDIKPENLLVSWEGAVKIADLGLARREQESVILTRPGQVLGTPYFMPPEQWEGDEVDHRADLYSLGATFYYLATGEHPFQGASGNEVHYKHLRAPVPRPSEIVEDRDPPPPPEVLETFDRIVARAMAKKPADRWASAEEIVAEIDALVGDDGLRTTIGWSLTGPPAALREVISTDDLTVCEPMPGPAQSALAGGSGSGFGSGATGIAIDDGDQTVAAPPLTQRPGSWRGQVDATPAPAASGRLTAGSVQGRRLGRYEVVRKIGQGGMGSVWRVRLADATVDSASDPDLASTFGELGPDFALKLLPPAVSRNPRLVARFLREVKATRVLRHPNVVRFVESGEEKGFHYYVMELVDGRDAKSLVRERNHLDPGSALFVFREAARGLAHAHDQGVLHRDLKPDNILVGWAGVVKLTDFGLARRAQESIALTRPGQALGTPYYMPPEQWEGAADDVDHRSDIYSLGATFFFTLTGERPYVGATPAEVHYKHMNAAIPRPSEEVAGTPAWTDELVAGCLAKAQGERFQSAAELLAAIDRVADEAGLAALGWSADGAPAGLIETPPPEPVPAAGGGAGSGASPGVTVAGASDLTVVTDADATRSWREHSASAPVPPRSAPAVISAAPSALEADATGGVIGRVLGRWRVLRKLGEGGMGSVYEVEVAEPGSDVSSIPELSDDAGAVLAALEGRSFALKLMTPTLSRNPKLAQRFVREMKATRVLQHDNVVRFVEHGEEKGFHYYVMEMVDGVDAKALVKTAGPLGVGEAVHVLRAATRGLSHAHAKGMIHRDIKPENLMIDRSGEVKVTDFGLARRDKESIILTTPGQVLGTPYYMPPEQWGAGEEDQVDHRSDLYALGGTLHFLLTGEPPFPANNPNEMLLRHVKRPPPKPSAKLRARAAAAGEGGEGEAAGVDEATGRLHGHLDAIVARAMAKGKDERYQSADEMLAAIDEILGDAALREAAGLDADGLPPKLGERVGRVAERTRDARRKTRPASAAGAVADRIAGSDDQTVASDGPPSERVTQVGTPMRVLERGTNAETVADERDSLELLLDSATELPTSGSEFGKYQIIDELQRGGMGVVYKAMIPSLNKMVALKVLLAGALASEAEKKRFRLEAESAANLSHPNIVAVHDVGELKGNYYYTMDFIEGRPLSDRLRERPLEPDAEAVPLAVKVCDAMHYAHLRGIIHRDLKPENVMLDRRGEPHVLDFGLAKRVFKEGDGSKKTAMTMTGNVLGTIRYMPPEQAEGRTTDVDVRSDVYSLGVVLFEMLTGRVPFDAANEREVLRMISDVDPRPPSQLVPGIPWELDTIVLKALEKEQARRYQSAAELKDDLERYAKGLPIRAKRTTIIYRMRKAVRRHRAASATAAVAALVLFAIVAFVVGDRMRQAAARERQVAETLGAAQAAYQEGMHEEARELFVQVLGMEEGHPEAIEGRTQAAMAVEEARREEARREAEAKRQADARSKASSAAERLAAGELEESKRLFQEALFLDGKNQAAQSGLVEANARISALEQERLAAEREREARDAAQAAVGSGEAALLEAGTAAETGDGAAAKEHLFAAIGEFDRALAIYPKLVAARVRKFETALQLGEISLGDRAYALARFLAAQARALLPAAGAPPEAGADALDADRVAAFDAEIDRTEKRETQYVGAIEKGDEALAAGRFDQAIAFFGDALAAFPEDAEATERLARARYGAALALARELQAEARWEDAISQFTTARDLAKDPTEADRGIAACRDRLYAALLEEARTALDAEEFERAAAVAGRAIEVRGDERRAEDAAAVRFEAIARAKPPEGMVFCPGGLYDVGTDRAFDQNPARKVRLGAYYLDAHEIDNAAFARFVAAGGYADDAHWDDEARPLRARFVDQTGEPGPAGWSDGAPPEGRQRHPVRGISFWEARAYARFVGKRLATDVEWEVAAGWDPRRRAFRVYPWGDVFEARYANLGTPSVEVTGLFPEDKSALGCYDMAGNVHEWTIATGPGVNGVPRAAAKGGGHGTAPFEILSRVALRKLPDPAFRGPIIGFRLARDVETP